MTPDAKALIALTKELRNVSENARSAGERIDAKRDLANITPQLADMLEIAMTAIEEAPHEPDCGIYDGSLLTKLGHPCTCWKSRVLAQLNPPTK